MNLQVKFPSLTWFTGRNGLFKSSGVNITTTCDGDLWIAPITSKNEIGHCDIIIHKDSVPELINKLKQLKEEK